MVLRGISPLISPDLLRILAQMGHGDEILFADAHFPATAIAASLASRTPVVHIPGISSPALVAAVIPLFALDTYADVPVMMMETVKGDTADPYLEVQVQSAVAEEYSGPIHKIERFAFYERSKKVFAIVATGESRKYGNIILVKGVTPLP